MCRSRAAPRPTPRCSAATRRCSGWKPLVEAGRLRLLMIWTANRSKNWPETPTLRELGYPFVLDSPFGVAGPKGMDPKIVAKLHDAFKKAIDDPAVQEQLAKYDMVVNYKNTEDYRAFVAETVETERKALSDLGLARRTRSMPGPSSQAPHPA